jgi:hypothetical protein
MKSKSGEKIIIDNVDLEYVFDNKLKVETECMSDNEDKEFIKLVLDKFIDQLEVIE